jgi:DNA-binding MarR family transcriptional regulator
MTAAAKARRAADPSALDEQAARLRLAITRTARRLRQQAGSDLGPSAAAALASIERLGPLTPSELAEAEGFKRPTATRIIARLEEEGMVERAADPADGRCALISISAAGSGLLDELRRRKTAYLARNLRELSAGELATLSSAADILERMLEEERR